MFYSIICIVLLQTVTHATPIPSVSSESVNLRGRMVGSSETTIEKHPWQVGLEYEGSDDYYSGAIISSNWVVTSGSAVADRHPKTIRAGSAIRHQGSVHEVDRVVLHENYTKGGENYLPHNDIALISIKNAFEFDEKRKIIELCFTDWVEHADSVVTGWGKKSRESTKYEEILRSVHTRIAERKACDRHFKEQGFIDGVPEGFICSLGEYQGPYLGDEGAPIQAESAYGQKVLVGVASTNNKKTMYDTYAEIFYYRRWIEKII